MNQVIFFFLAYVQNWVFFPNPPWIIKIHVEKKESFKGYI